MDQTRTWNRKIRGRASGVPTPGAVRMLFGLGAVSFGVGFGLVIFAGLIGVTVPVVSVWLFLGGILVLMLAAAGSDEVDCRARNALIERGLRTVATVTAVHGPRDGTTELSYLYLVAGVEYTGSMPVEQQRPGDTLDILYDPNSPGISGVLSQQ